MFASLMLLWAFDSAGSAPSQLPPNIAWASATAEDDRFWIKSEDISTQYYPAGVIVWLRGEHGYNSHAGYKTSLQQIRFYCNGTLRLMDLTTVDARGRSSKWHGDGDVSRIKPRTVYADIERKFCSS